MSDRAISAMLASGAAAPTVNPSRDPAKVRDGAQQFEALLMGQVLRSARQGNAGWLGEEDSSAECATDYAEQQFAAVLASQGGLGMADLIAKGLEQKR